MSLAEMPYAQHVERLAQLIDHERPDIAGGDGWCCAAHWSLALLEDRARLAAIRIPLLEEEKLALIKQIDRLINGPLIEAFGDGTPQ